MALLLSCHSLLSWTKSSSGPMIIIFCSHCVAYHMEYLFLLFLLSMVLENTEVATQNLSWITINWMWFSEKFMFYMLLWYKKKCGRFEKLQLVLTFILQQGGKEMQLLGRYYHQQMSQEKNNFIFLLMRSSGEECKWHWFSFEEGMHMNTQFTVQYNTALCVFFYSPFFV